MAVQRCHVASLWVTGRDMVMKGKENGRAMKRITPFEGCGTAALIMRRRAGKRSQRIVAINDLLIEEIEETKTM